MFRPLSAERLLCVYKTPHLAHKIHIVLISLHFILHYVF